MALLVSVFVLTISIQLLIPLCILPFLQQERFRTNGLFCFLFPNEHLKNLKAQCSEHYLYKKKKKKKARVGWGIECAWNLNQMNCRRLFNHLLQTESTHKIFPFELPMLISSWKHNRSRPLSYVGLTNFKKTSFSVLFFSSPVSKTDSVPSLSLRDTIIWECML